MSFSIIVLLSIMSCACSYVKRLLELMIVFPNQVLFMMASLSMMKTTENVNLSSLGFNEQMLLHNCSGNIGIHSFIRYVLIAFLRAILSIQVLSLIKKVTSDIWTPTS